MHIDWWTLFIQAANVLILVWLLARFFWRPLRKIIDQRKEASVKLIADAQAAQAAADTEKAANIAMRAGFAAERDTLLAEAKAQIDREREIARKTLAQEAAHQYAQGQEAIARERKAMEQDLASKAAALAVDIARRLLSKAQPLSAARSFDFIAAKIQQLPPHSHDQLIRFARDGSLTLVSAVPLDDSEKALLRQSLGTALGTIVQPVFVVDPALLFGIALKSDTLEINNNWQDDLNQILSDLKKDEQQ